jgi:general transcription factor 3C polypeptide 3 (transcription factor C subunit 4)
MVQDFPDLFRDVADALHATGYNEQALRFYEPLYDKCYKQMSLRNFIGMYSAYEDSGNEEKAGSLISLFREWNSDSLEDMAVLAKFFEDHGYEDDAMTRGESVYKHGGGRLLQKVDFQGFAVIQEYFNYEKKRARGRHGVRKARVKKYMKALRTATRDEDDSPGEDADGPGDTVPVLGLDTARPKPGLFRTRKSYPNYRPKTFLPEEIPGTHVPIDAIDHILFQKKLNSIANDFPDELKAARAQHREIIASFKRLDQLTGPAEDGDEDSTTEWISIARELIEEFSTFDLFYYDRRKPFAGYFRRIGAHNDLWKDSALMVLAVVANNVENGEDEPEIQERPDKIPEEFYGIHFDRWFDAFALYAILLARRGDDERCFNTIEVASQSNIFYRSQQYYHQLQLCRLACAIALDNSIQSASSIRWFMRTYPFSGDLFRIYGIANRLCSIPTGFATGPSLKVFLRYIKTMDYALLRRDQREWFNFRGSDHLNWMAKGAQTESVNFVKDHDPAIFTLYAHVLMCGGSYTAALNYYFRAFAIRPQDPVLNLSIGVAYIQHAMKRLSENRQYQLQQGLSFIYRYYDLRTKDKIPEYCSEAEYNLGRIWHSLGLTSQAITAYERCIQLSEHLRTLPKDQGGVDNTEVDNFATEAAFSIQTIYALSGNFEDAKRVTERVLVLE